MMIDEAIAEVITQPTENTEPVLSAVFTLHMEDEVYEAVETHLHEEFIILKVKV
jgi:hypothetical protein